MLYYNARSIIPKLDELRILVPIHNPDVICIVESWLDNSILDSELTISNYNLLRLDRNRHGGGILLYIRDSLSFSMVLSGPKNLEFLCITIHSVSHLHASNFCLGVLYNLPDNVCYVLSTLRPRQINSLFNETLGE